MNDNRLIKAIIVGAIMGVTLEYLIRPYITKPIIEKVDEVIDK